MRFKEYIQVSNNTNGLISRKKRRPKPKRRDPKVVKPIYDEYNKVMLGGKYKGYSFQRIWEVDRSYVEFMASIGKKDFINFLALKTANKI